MKHPSKALVLIVLLLVSFPHYTAEAARTAPEEVEPLIYNGIKYAAPQTRMGYVEAYYVDTGIKLWETKVYDVSIAPWMESDVQTVFITELRVEDGNLIVTNERGKKYQLDTRTGEVRTNNSSTNYTAAIVAIFAFGLLYLKFARNQKR